MKPPHWLERTRAHMQGHECGLDALGGNGLHQVDRPANGFCATKLDAVLRPFKHRRQGFQFSEHRARILEHFIGEVDQHVAQGHHFILAHLADPVMGQVGAGEEQCLRVKVANVVADKHLAATGRR